MQQVKLMLWILLGLMLARALTSLNKERVDYLRHMAFSKLTPCLFFLSIYRADLELLPPLKLLATYLSTLVGLFFLLRLCLLATWEKDVSGANIKSIAALFPNTVGVGVPVIFALYGPEAELILMGIVVVNLVCVLPLMNILLIRSGEQGYFRYRNIILDPILMSIFSGMACNIIGVELPYLITSGLSIVSWIALPLILFVLGASISFYPIHSLMKEKVISLMVVKLLVFPLTTLVIANYVMELSVLETQVLVILTALPTGINVYLLSERYRVAKEATASVILFTTMFSMVSLLGWEMVTTYFVT